MIRRVATLAALFSFACSPGAKAPTTCADCAPGTGGVQLALSMTTSGIGRVTVTVSAPDIQPAITQELTVAGDPPVASGTISNVPAGAGRVVTLEARAAAPEQDLVVYRGSATTDVGAGTVAPLGVVLLPVVKALPVVAVFPVGGAALAPVHHVAVSVSGARIAAPPATFYLALDAAEGIASSTVSAVPVGSSRTVTVSAFDGGGAVLYLGTTATSVLEGVPSGATVLVASAGATGGIDVGGTLCVPACGGAICGDDGCGGSCGGCLPGATCTAGACLGPSPDPSPPSSAERVMSGITPNAIWGTSPSDIWLWSKQDRLGMGGQTEHWDGTSWTTTAGIPGDARIFEIWGASTADVWAVGYLGMAAGPSEFGPASPPTGEIYHWDGSTWSPSFVTSLLLGCVWGSGPADVWAAGRDASGEPWVTSRRFVLHWDGAAWSPVPLEASARITALWGSGPADVYAAGGPDGLFRWDGSGWTTITLPDPPYETAAPWDVWGTSSVDVWVVGNGPGSGDGHIWHWDGTAWSRTHTVAGTSFEIVRGGAANDVWALGHGLDGALVAHFDGSTWTDGALDPLTTFYDAWARGPGDLLTVISFGSSSGEVRRLSP